MEDNIDVGPPPLYSFFGPLVSTILKAVLSMSLNSSSIHNAYMSWKIFNIIYHERFN